MHPWLALLFHRDYFAPVRCISVWLFCSTGIISTGWMHLYLVLLCRRDYFGRPDASHHWKAIAKNISARPFCQLQVCRASPTIVPGCTPLAWLNVKRCTPYRKRKKMHPLWQINTFLWIVIPECRGSLLPGIWLRFDYVSLPQFVTICRVLQISVTFPGVQVYVNRGKTGRFKAFQEGFWHDKNIIRVPRQDSWTTCNPRNNGAKWGIIRCLPGYETTGRLLFFFFKRKSVKVIVNTVYIVWTPLKVIVIGFYQETTTLRN